MASGSNFGAKGAPNLNLTPEEKRIYGILFRQADTENVGVVTGDIAVQFFEKTRLDSRILGEIWQIADRENCGFLQAADFGVALRLIGHAQGGREPNQDLALQPGPIPQFDGISTGPPPSAAPIQQQTTGAASIRIPPLTPEKVAQYTDIFEGQPALEGNVLPGGPAKEIFEKSLLPNELLGRIWQLADTEGRGGLVLTEFVIAMHLLTSMKTGTLRALPSILPAGLYEAATKRAPAPRQSPMGTGAPVSAIPRQLSGQTQPRTSSPLGRPPIGPQGTGMSSSQLTGGDWLVTPAEKAKYDQHFADLDKTNTGFITGSQAVPFLSQSKLSEDALAQIWDLADIKSEGQLNKDTFAVAMYLIRQQRTKGGPLPTALPPNLVPPSLRTQPRAAPGPSPFDPPAPAPVAPHPPVQPKSALDDLFGLDASPAPISPQGTASGARGVPNDGPAASRTTSPIQTSPTGNTFKPFVPSSSFGRALTTSHDTGGSASSSQGAKGAQPSHMEDLLGDHNPEMSKKLNDDSTELANLSNQVSSLSKQMQQVQGQRGTTQTEINQASEQKKNFEQRLSQLRTLYEKEVKDVQVLEEQLRTLRDETRKLTSEMVSIDGNYQDLKAQHQQVSQGLEADQQENASLKQRISSVNAEISQLKPQIERLKSEARQQKGLVAINKKQLSTVEGERDKMQTEVEDLTKSNEELSRQAASSSPVAAQAQVASPAPSTTSANNPFFRRTGSSDIMGAFASPTIKSYNDKSFDDIFGGFAPGSGSGTPPPPTSFKQQNTGTSSTSVGSFATPIGSTPTISRQPTSNVETAPVSESRQTGSPFPPFGGESSEPPAPQQPGSPPFTHTLETATTGRSATSASEASQSLTSSAQNEPKDTNSTSGSALDAFSDDTSTPGASKATFTKSRDSDPFAAMKDSGNAKVDFDSAFASFPSSSSKPQEKSSQDSSNAFSTFNTEFPPISELDRDDESDSASEDNRFDDDFTSVSPPRPKGDSGAANTTSSPTGAKAVTFLPEDSAAKSHATKPSNLSDLSAFPEPPKVSPTFPSPTKTDSPYAAAPMTAAGSAPTGTAKSAFDEMDDDFEGLEDAKEGSADDEFANISRSNLDDFNPVFDSPPPSQPRTESSNAAFGTESSYDFGHLSSTSAAATGVAPAANTSSSATGSNKGPSPPDNHDWDAIFASLDSPGDKDGAKEQTSPTGGLNVERPSFTGRALTEEGKHDDPMVKNLTTMGYSRADAVSALEKYDYNLEKAADHLASQP